MATYSRLGSYLLSSELSADPIGRIHRGIVLVGDKFDRHVLVRTFFDELIQHAIAGRMAEASKAVPQLGGSKAFGVGYRMEAGTTPHVVCDYVPGRSLAQLLVKAKHEQIPFGVDHALSVMQGIAQGLLQLHAKGLHHGILSPHSVWVSFEGATHILDAPFASQIKAMLPKTPVTQTSLDAYISDSGTTLQQDFFSLGAILFEMLTLDRIVAKGDLGSLVKRATLKAAQEEAPIPAEIQGLLLKLLGIGSSFGTDQEFNGEMERVLYDGDYSPTTFNMAFFMHTLFREENDTDTQAMKFESTDNFSAYQMVAKEAAAGGRHTGHIVEDESEVQKSKKMLYIGAGVGIPAILILGFLALKPKGPTEKEKAMEARLAIFEREKAENEMKLANLVGQGRDVQAEIQKKERALQEARTVEEKKKAAQELEEQQKKQAELEKKKLDLEAKTKAAEIHAQNVARGVDFAPVTAPPVHKPEPAKVEAPKPEPPKPEAAKPAPTPAAPTPAPAQATTTISQGVEVPVQILATVTPNYPNRAKQAKQMLAGRDLVVVLEVFVDATGRPQKVKILSGVDGPYGFNEEAEKAALESKFQAGSRDGRPISGRVNMTFRFGKAR